MMKKLLTTIIASFLLLPCLCSYAQDRTENNQVGNNNTNYILASDGALSYWGAWDNPHYYYLIIDEKRLEASLYEVYASYGEPASPPRILAAAKCVVKSNEIIFSPTLGENRTADFNNNQTSLSLNVKYLSHIRNLEFYKSVVRPF